MATIHTFPGSPFQRALAAGVQADVPTAVIGEPGQGKTATMESATSGWAVTARRSSAPTVKRLTSWV